MSLPWTAIAIDTGGTFTDVIAIDDNNLQVFKLPSTPKNPANAVQNAINRLDGAKEIIHGTTVATNAILERKGAKVALITTEGFADVIEIGRQNRDDIYALYPSRTEPLVEKSHRFEVKERITANGDVLHPLDEMKIKQLVALVEEKQPESIAITLLFSFLYPNHEKMIGKALQHIAPVSLSSHVHPEYREYERTSTTVVDAYIKPVISQYLNNLSNYVYNRKLAKNLAVMKSDRGLAMINSIVKRPVDTIFSGLAGGIQAVEFAASITGISNLLSIDIGGTSTDVSAIINGNTRLQQSQEIDGLPVARPAVDVVTIGAGGGSLVQFQAGLLRVGPESAGADPGPIAYELGGTVPTVTDLDLVYGILPEDLAGGVLTLNKEKSEEALKQFAIEVDMQLDAFISGTRNIFHENIAGAIRSVSTQRGYDPRNFTLIAFGGAGPVHACEIADVMNINQVLIPPYPGVWSSMGLLGADYQYSSSIGRVVPISQISDENINLEIANLKQNVNDQANTDDLDITEAIYQPSVALRFVGQSFELTVQYQSLSQARSDFISLHRERYGFAAENEPVELVSIQMTLVLPHPSPTLPEFKGTDQFDVIKYHSIEDNKIPVYDKSSLSINKKIVGPMIILQDDTTIWIPQDWITEIDKFGFMHIHKNNN